MLEKQVDVRQREVEELQSQAHVLRQEGKDTDEVDGRRQEVELKFKEMLDPLLKRKDFLMASREIHQFNRDMEDEIVRLGLYMRVDVELFVCLTSCFSSALGWRADASRYVNRPWPQFTDCSAAYQEEPGNVLWVHYFFNYYVSLEHKSSISITGIFVAIANNTVYGSKLYIFLLCQKSLGY